MSVMRNMPVMPITAVLKGQAAADFVKRDLDELKRLSRKYVRHIAAGGQVDAIDGEYLVPLPRATETSHWRWAVSELYALLDRESEALHRGESIDAA